MFRGGQARHQGSRGALPSRQPRRHARGAWMGAVVCVGLCMLGAHNLHAGSAPLPLQLLATLAQDTATVRWELHNTGRAALRVGLWTCSVWDNFSSSAPDALDLKGAECDKNACTARTLEPGGRLSGTLAVVRPPGGRGGGSFRLGFKPCSPHGVTAPAQDAAITWSQPMALR